MNKYVWLLALTAFNVTECFANTQPTFSLVANTPTAITVPANRHAYVQYRVTNNTSVTRTLTMTPIPNVTQVTTGNTCSNPFTLGRNQSCNLTLYIDGALQRSDYSGGPVICKANSNNTPNPFLCSQPEQSMVLSIHQAPAVIPTTNKLYVSNWDGGSISMCSIANSGNIFDCLVSAVSDTFLNPEALAINGNYLFVANIGGGISSCSIDINTGELTNCSNAINDNTATAVNGPDGIAIQVVNQDTFAYIANSSADDASKQGVTKCTVSGPSLSNCTFTNGGHPEYFSIPSDLALFNNTAYITNFNSQTIATYCTDGNLTCTVGTVGTITSDPSLLNEPEGLFITTINTTAYAYFTNHGSHTVTRCVVTAPTNFNSCYNTEGYFTGFGNLTILASPLKAFIPSGLKTIALCNVNSTTGALSDCIDSTELSFNNPSGLVIK